MILDISAANGMSKNILFANGYQNIHVTGGWMKDPLKNDGQADGDAEIGRTMHLCAYRSTYVQSNGKTGYLYHDVAVRTVAPINVDGIDFVHLKIESWVGETIKGWVGLSASIDNITRNDYGNEESGLTRVGYTVFDETVLAESNIVTVDVSKLSGDFYPVIFLIGVDAEYDADGSKVYDAIHVSKVWLEKEAGDEEGGDDKWM